MGSVSVKPLIFLSTPSARRATTIPLILNDFHFISIHALREEGDGHANGQQRNVDISIHALREEGDVSPMTTYPAQPIFLSTPSARRATSCSAIFQPLPKNFYPRPPRGGRPRSVQQDFCRNRISIHALREEGDLGTVDDADFLKVFLSTPSARRATVWKTHHGKRRKNFYPRPPRGGRRQNL